MVGDFILYLALIQLGAVTAITAAVVGALLLIYRSVPDRNAEICGGADKQPKQGNIIVFQLRKNPEDRRRKSSPPDAEKNQGETGQDSLDSSYFHLEGTTSKHLNTKG